MKRFVIALMYILSFSLLFGQMNELRIEGKAEFKDGIIISKEIVDKNLEQAALLVFLTDLDTDFVFRPSNGKVRDVDKSVPGKFEVYVSPGERTIKVNATGFKEFEVVLSSYGIRRITSGEVYVLNITGDSKVTELPVLITTKPANAKVFVNDKSYGNTTSDGLSLSLESGKQILKIELDGHSSITEEIEIKRGKQNFNYTLVPAVDAVVTINSEPQGATVWIKGVKFGVTPKTSFFPTGIYTVKVEKENYSTIEENIEIVDGLKKLYKLSDTRAIITINTLENATCYINGVKQESAVDSLKIAPGLLRVKIEAPYCETIEKEYTLKDNETRVLDLYPDDVTCTLSVNTHPNATVTVNNSKQYKGGFKELKLTPQVVELIVEMPKAPTINHTVLLEKNANIVKNLYPEIETGTILINVIPTESKVICEGDSGERYESIGKAIFTDVPIGNYDLVIQHQGYLSHKENLRLDANHTFKQNYQLTEGQDIPDIISSTGYEMVVVDGGTFIMGDKIDDHNYHMPHEVTVSDFCISKYEITEERYNTLVPDEPVYDPNHAVEVTWYSAVEFCNILSEKEGLTPCYSINKKKKDKNNKNKRKHDKIKWTVTCDFDADGYRLPTEAEWEYAARGGNKSNGYLYAGTNDFDAVSDDSYGRIEVGQKTPNELGIHDLSGSKEEWCWDWYDYSYWNNNPKTINPKGADEGEERVARGGLAMGEKYSYQNRVFHRSYSRPSSSEGFRIVRTINQTNVQQNSENLLDGLRELREKREDSDKELQEIKKAVHW